MPHKGPFILHFTENDLLPFIQFEWEHVDVTGFTILLHVRKPNGLRFTRNAVIDDANFGGADSALFHFEWIAGDLVEGDSMAELEFINLSAKNQTLTTLILRVAKEIS